MNVIRVVQARKHLGRWLVVSCVSVIVFTLVLTFGTSTPISATQQSHLIQSPLMPFIFYAWAGWFLSTLWHGIVLVRTGESARRQAFYTLGALFLVGLGLLFSEPGSTIEPTPVQGFISAVWVIFVGFSVLAALADISTPCAGNPALSKK